MTKTDIAIVGAGPAGLCLAAALARAGLEITLLERLPRAALEQPGFDGREIALAHRSVALMKRLGLWSRVPPEEISPLRDARVFNGTSRRSIHLDHGHGGRGCLGYLVPNHLIRAAAFAAIKDAPEVALWSEAQVTAVRADAHHADIRLSDGRALSARLVVAADSRFSEMRRNFGIPTRMRDFGRSILVCRVIHEVPHDHTAWEWFDHGQTLALLPLGREGDPRNRSSVVLTLPAACMDELRSVDEEAFGRELDRRFHGRLGRMRLDSERTPASSARMSSGPSRGAERHASRHGAEDGGRVCRSGPRRGGGAVLQQMRGEAVPQRVHRHPLVRPAAAQAERQAECSIWTSIGLPASRPGNSQCSGRASRQ